MQELSLVKLDDIEYKHLAMESYWYGKARAVPNVEGLSYGGLTERRSSITCAAGALAKKKELRSREALSLAIKRSRHRFFRRV